MATKKLDRKGKRAKWAKARSAESAYNSKLRAVAKQVKMLIKGLSPDGNPSSVPALVKALTEYAKTIEPWADAVARYMLADVHRLDRAMWRRTSAEMGKQLRRELEQAPTGAVLSALQGEQVKLIKSLPLAAAERAQELAQETLLTSGRAKAVANEILGLGDVTEGRAMLIARTEVSRAASNLVQARSTYAGSAGYIWRTSGDDDVRDSHAEMEGKYVRWASPPKLDNLIGHAGTLPNCRCFAEPVFPDD